MKTVVVGAGRMGRRHIDVVLELGMECVGIVDRSLDAARGAAEAAKLGDEVVFDDFAAALAATGPEAVVISTTAPSHCLLTLEAAKAGVKYILCEKPMGVSVAECDAMIAACAEAGAVLAINHQMRFMPQYTELKPLIESPEFGGLSAITVTAGNFGISMNGSHYFEMFRYMTGEPAETVQAWFDDAILPNPRGAEFEDRSGQVRVQNASGQSMYIDTSGAAGHGLQVTYVCRNGQILADELAGWAQFTRREDEYRELPTSRYGMPAITGRFEFAGAEVMGPTKSVWEAMLAGEPFPDGEAGRHAVRCLVAAHESHDKGGVKVRIDQVDRDQVFPWA